MIAGPATLPVTDKAESVDLQVQRLTALWTNAIAHHSSSTIRHNHPAYQEIIRIGWAAVPWLLRDMEQNQTHWFHALRQITGTNPVPESAAGNVPEMIRAWLNWATENGYRR